MKINELIQEDGIGGYLRSLPLANVFGREVTAGDVEQATGIDPRTAIDYGKKAYDIATTKLFDLPGGLGPYTVGDAMIDVPLLIGDIATLGSMTPALLARVSSRVASGLGAKELERIAARKGAQTVARDTSQAELTAAGRAAADRAAIRGGTRSVATHAAADAIRSNVSLDPLGLFSKGSGSTSAEPKKKKRYQVGDIVSIRLGSNTHKVPIVNVLPSGYVVSLGKVPGKSPEDTMDIPEPD
jgi:hypothetical protein